MSRYRVNTPDVVYEEVEGELVLLDLRRGLYFSLNESATILWKAFAGGMSVKDCLGALESAADANASATIERTLHSMLDHLLLAERGDSPVEQFSLEGLGSLLARQAPQIHCFDDLEDLLRLDPIHEVSDEGWPINNKSK